jgi:rRNA processing protein Gar1
MKWLLVLISIVGAGAYFHNKSTPEQALPKVIAEYNKKLPMQGDGIRLDELKHIGNVIQVHGTILDNAAKVSDEDKSVAKKHLSKFYCSQAFHKLKMNVEYHFQQFALRNISDKAKLETFVITLTPSDCL